MKYRQDFVTNSSSSSFIISLDDITAKQLQKIENVASIAQLNKIPYWEYAGDWHVYIEGNNVKGYCSMDNFDMGEYLKSIGVDMRNVKFVY